MRTMSDVGIKWPEEIEGGDLNSVLLAVKTLTYQEGKDISSGLKDLLLKWWARRSQEGLTTQEMLQRADNEIERIIISIIALRDVNVHDPRLGLSTPVMHFVDLCHSMLGPDQRVTH